MSNTWRMCHHPDPRHRQTNSPGLWPSSVSGSPLDCLAVKTILLSYCIGTPLAQKLHIIEYAKSPWRPFFAPRLDFCDFLTALNAIEKTTIFRHGPKSIKSTMKSTLCKWLHDLYQNLTTLNDHLTENVRFRVPLRISKGAKMALEFTIFCKKATPKHE